MAEAKLIQSSRDASSTAVPVWSSGFFSPRGLEVPRACLACCLGGDAGLAGRRGCAMLRRLVSGEAWADADTGPVMEVPDRCDRGLRVNLRWPAEGTDTTTLVLAAETGPVDGGLVDYLHELVGERSRLSRENEGLANEVLQCYEQVNLIFDISREVAELSQEDQVRRAMLAKLQHIYSADGVFCIDLPNDVVVQLDGQECYTELRAGRLLQRLDGSDAEPRLLRARLDGADGVADAAGWRLVEHADSRLPAECPTALARLRQSRQVFVAIDHAATGDQEGHGTSMWGPLECGPDQTAYVGVVRRGRPFTAGDMQLLDSTLTFAGHILSNLRLVEQLRRASFESVRALVNAIDQKDPYTCGHSERVGFLSRMVGEHLGLPARQLQELEWGGLLHDIGKIGIPGEVLNKPGALTPQEFELITHHPARGFAVLAPVQSLRGVLEIVLYHHETPDGRGYPKGLKGEQIPLLARIVHVTDTYDALTSTRSYRKAFNHERAIEILSDEVGVKFDPDIVAAFIEAWDRLPQTHPDAYERWQTTLKPAAFPAGDPPGGAA